jgi:hypothetical protein
MHDRTNARYTDCQLTIFRACTKAHSELVWITKCNRVNPTLNSSSSRMGRIRPPPWGDEDPCGALWKTASLKTKAIHDALVSGLEVLRSRSAFKFADRQEDENGKFIRIDTNLPCAWRSDWTASIHITPTTICLSGFLGNGWLGGSEPPRTQMPLPMLCHSSLKVVAHDREHGISWA